MARFPLWPFLFLAAAAGSGLAVQINPGSSLVAGEGRAWVSDNGTFAFGFVPIKDRFGLGIWFAQLPGDQTSVVWSPNINSPVSKDAILEFNPSGNLLLRDDAATSVVWTSNTRAQTAFMSENGNFILYGPNNSVVWQSFSFPSDTLLPGQPLTTTLELRGGYYSLKMLQQATSLRLGLTYNLGQSNLSYWSGPEISNVTGDVVAVLGEGGSFGMVYGSSSDGAVYVYKNDNDSEAAGLLSVNGTTALVIRRLVLEGNGNLRLYRWDNGSRQWVTEWAAVSKPCSIAGICGNGICSMDRTKTNTSCTCLPGSLGGDNKGGGKCAGSSSIDGKSCSPHRGNLTSQFKVSEVQQTNYYFSGSSVIVNYSDIDAASKCGDACLSDCRCVASVYALNEEKPYCWLLNRLDFGGYEDPGSTLFVKVDDSSINKGKVLVLPIVLSMVVLIGLLVCLLYIYVHRKRTLKRALESSLIVSGAPISFTYRDLQGKTSNFSELLGTGGFGSVYKGSLSDGTMIAVKKLDRVLPHGEKEFVTEVNTISSMHHMNLVRLWGYCSEGSRRLLVYEFMKNGSLDKWIFPAYNGREACDRLLDWPTRFSIAIGMAQGIAYFHEQCRNRIIHCDIKPENILLDDNFCPKVSDFGLAKLMGREASRVVTMVRGTRGYLAPEWVSNRPITVKADVYSYGMLLLEIIGGRRNLDMSYDAEDFFYPGWAFKELTNGRAKKIVDRRLQGVVDEEEVRRAVKAAFWCIQDEIATRPSMGEVVKILEGSMDAEMPPMPQTVLELIEEGLDQVYKAMKRDLNHFTSFTTTTHPSSLATCSYSTMSPR